MLNANVHIISMFDCLMRFYENEKEIFSLNSLGFLGNEISLKIENAGDFQIKLYPFNKKNENQNIAYTANFKVINSELFCENKQVNIFNLPQNHIIIKFNPINLQSQNFNNFDKVENVGNSIKTLKILPTISKKGEVEVYEINGDKASFKEKYYVSFLNKKNKLNNDAIRLLQFFEDLKFGSDEDIKDRFTISLSEKLSDTTIKNFFGNFDEARLVNYFEQPAVALLDNKNKQAKVFNASFDNGLIDNIIEIE